jgi:hypothetical protein
MNLLTLREPAETAETEERRVREYVEAPAGVSESAWSLSDKLGISHRHCRGILERLAAEGVLTRRDLPNAEPMFVRFPTRWGAEPTTPVEPLRLTPVQPTNGFRDRVRFRIAPEGLA